MEYKDNLKYIDKETDSALIFNFNTWISVIKGVMIKYAHKTEEEANHLIKERNFKLPESYDEVIFYSHDIEFHWAMLLAHGDGYWLRGISSEEPSDYIEWESQYRIDHALKEDSFEFID